MKKLLAIMLVLCLLTGCQLASPEQTEEPGQDKLVGVFITFEPMELEFDIEGWLKDNPGILGEGDVTLDFGEGQEYAGILPVTLGEDCWVVPGYEGLSLGRLITEEYATTFVSEGVCEVNSHLSAGDDGDDIEVNGTVYFPAGTEVMLCTNPVYETPDGTYYLVQGQSFHSTVEAGGSMSQSVSDEKSQTQEEVTARYAAKYTTTVKGVILPDTVRLVWMTAEHKELGRAEYIPGELPESAAPPAGAAYLIVEELTGDAVNRTLYQPGSGTVKVFYQGEQPWCLPDYLEILWSE